jgi:hypothetical protein
MVTRVLRREFGDDGGGRNADGSEEFGHVLGSRARRDTSRRDVAGADDPRSLTLPEERRPVENPVAGVTDLDGRPR